MERELALNDFEELVKKHPDLQYIDAIFFDNCGHARGKRFTREEGEKVYTQGMQIPESCFLLNVDGDSSDPCGRGMEDGDPDGTLFPIPGTTAIVPWRMEKSGQVLTRMFSDDGTPCLVDPRNVASMVVNQFNTLGFIAEIAFELEFYLLDQKLDWRGRPQMPLSHRTGARGDEFQVYSMEDLDEQMEFMNNVNEYCKEQRIPASVLVSEYSPSQYEINLRHVDDPLSAADHCMLLRRVIQAVAKTQGMRATFMSKPFTDLSGSGMHVHLSLKNKMGENVFVGDSPLGNSLLRHVVGGLLHSMGDMIAIFAPHENAYRRFVPESYVPLTRSWGANNRSVAVRIPAGEEGSRRLEHRIAGADANPYLVLAAILAGVHYGLEHSVDPGPPAIGTNAVMEIDPSLPFDWSSAIDRLRNSEFAADYLSSNYVELFCELKSGEREKFGQYITDREYNWYL